jgi:hypothetical protein
MDSMELHYNLQIGNVNVRPGIKQERETKGEGRVLLAAAKYKLRLLKPDM